MPVMVTTFAFFELLDELLSASELTEDELLIAATLLDEIMGAAELELMGVVLGESPPPPPPQADIASIKAPNALYLDRLFIRFTDSLVCGCQIINILKCADYHKMERVAVSPI
jgi:hypothetical protein